MHLGAQAGVRYSVEDAVRVRRQQRDRNANGAGGMPAQRRRASRVCVHELGLRRQHADAVLRAPERRSSAVALRRDEEEQRADGATYSSLYGLPVTGLRFFTVYGPFGRPDMALFLFTKAILAGKPIDVFNYGHHRRDFTYVGDIVEGVVRALDRVARAESGVGRRAGPIPSTSKAPYRIYNIGNEQPVELHALHRGARGLPRPQGGEELAADAAGRRARHLGRRRGPRRATSVTGPARRSSRACAASSIGISTITK